VTSVWVGNDDNSPSRRASGATMPLDIWGQVMKAAHQGRPASPLPGGPFRPGVSAPLPAPVAGGLPPGLDPARDGGSGTGTLARELRPPAGVTVRPAPAPEPNLFQRLFGG
jgi:penicillin-binding protein 1A